MKADAVLSLALGLLVSKVHSIGSVGQAEGYIDTSPQPFDLNGSNYTYPYPVHVYNFESQFQELQMAFMDVPPAANVTSNGQIPMVAVLFHGSEFHVHVSFILMTISNIMQQELLWPDVERNHQRADSSWVPRHCRRPGWLLQV